MNRLAENPARHRGAVAWLLCFGLGVFGAHRFYAGRWRTGLLYLLTLGLFGIGMVVDLVRLSLGEFRWADDTVESSSGDDPPREPMPSQRSEPVAD